MLICTILYMGYVDKLDIINVLAALESALNNENLFGAGVAAAEKFCKGEI